MQGHDVWRVKHGDKDYQVECLDCGKTFEATRSDATFCSPRCRTHYHRAPQRLQNSIEELSGMGTQAFRMAQSYSRNRRVYEAMLKLRKDLDSALNIFETD